MARARTAPDLIKIAEYHNDAMDGLRRLFQYFIDSSAPRFIGYSPAEVHLLLNDRLQETDIRSCMALLAALEAAFRVDYVARCTAKKKDALSRDLRELHKTRAERASLEDELLAHWVTHHPTYKEMLGEFKGALKFRHWIAHGRYWQPKLGRKYDFTYLYGLAKTLLETLPLNRS